MASTYSALLGIELMGTGENATTWGTKTNNNLSPLIETSICGRATATFATDANTTISITDGTDSTGRYYIINAVSSGSLTATRDLIVPLRAGKTYVVHNNTTGSQSIRVIGSSGTGITIPTGKTGIVYNDGTNYKQLFDFATGLKIEDSNIGATTPGTGAFTTITATGNVSQTASVAGDLTNVVQNTSSNAAARAYVYVRNGTSGGTFQHTGLSFSPSSIYRADGTLLLGNGTGGLTIGTTDGQSTFFVINNTERMKLASDGSLLVNTSAAGGWATTSKMEVYTATNSTAAMSAYNAAASGGAALMVRADTTSIPLCDFRNGVGAQVGTISHNGTNTAYNTSSDYRLKNIEGPLTGSGAFIDALKPKVGTWKSNGSAFVGFVADELQQVSPSSVHGEKDAVDESGDPIYQAVAYSSPEVVANIIAELQSLRARLAALEAK